MGGWRESAQIEKSSGEGEQTEELRPLYCEAERETRWWFCVEMHLERCGTVRKTNK